MSGREVECGVGWGICAVFFFFFFFRGRTYCVGGVLWCTGGAVYYMYHERRGGERVRKALLLNR